MHSDVPAVQEADRATEAFKVASENLKAALPKQEPPKPPEEEASAADGDTMHFERPAQLHEILSELEEQNLFLIQNGQEVEEELEALKSKLKCASPPWLLPARAHLSIALSKERGRRKSQVCSARVSVLQDVADAVDNRASRQSAIF